MYFPEGLENTPFNKGTQKQKYSNYKTKTEGFHKRAIFQIFW